MSPSVFISFASKDVKVAMTLCKALESRGINCWISARDIQPGENFQIAIVQAIRHASLLLLVFTSNSNTSEEMTKELALASQQKKIVIPLRIEEVAPSDAFAYEFATRQWIDFFANWEFAVEQLAARINHALADPALSHRTGAIPAPVAAPAAEPAAPPAPAPAVEAKTEPAIAEVKAPDPKISEPKPPEAKVPEAKTPDAKAPEPKAPEPKAVEPKAPEPKAATETKAPEVKVAAVEPKPALETKPAPAPEGASAKVVPLAPAPTKRPDLGVTPVTVKPKSFFASTPGKVAAAAIALLVILAGLGLAVPAFLKSSTKAEAGPAPVAPAAVPVPFAPTSSYASATDPAAAVAGAEVPVVPAEVKAAPKKAAAQPAAEKPKVDIPF